MLTLNDGSRVRVTENLGYMHAIGHYGKMVLIDGKERLVVKEAGQWRRWTAADRAAPLIEGLARKAREDAARDD